MTNTVTMTTPDVVINLTPDQIHAVRYALDYAVREARYAIAELESQEGPTASKESVIAQRSQLADLETARTQFCAISNAIWQAS
jgi:hypothetical protein